MVNIKQQELQQQKILKQQELQKEKNIKLQQKLLQTQILKTKLKEQQEKARKERYKSSVKYSKLLKRIDFFTTPATYEQALELIYTIPYNDLQQEQLIKLQETKEKQEINSKICLLSCDLNYVELDKYIQSLPTQLQAFANEKKEIYIKRQLEREEKDRLYRLKLSEAAKKRWQNKKGDKKENE